MCQKQYGVAWENKCLLRQWSVLSLDMYKQSGSTGGRLGGGVESWKSCVQFYHPAHLKNRRKSLSHNVCQPYQRLSRSVDKKMKVVTHRRCVYVVHACSLLAEVLLSLPEGRRDVDEACSDGAYDDSCPDSVVCVIVAEVDRQQQRSAGVCRAAVEGMLSVARNRCECPPENADACLMPWRYGEIHLAVGR